MTPVASMRQTDQRGSCRNCTCSTTRARDPPGRRREPRPKTVIHEAIKARGGGGRTGVMFHLMSSCTPDWCVSHSWRASASNNNARRKIMAIRGCRVMFFGAGWPSTSLLYHEELRGNLFTRTTQRPFEETMEPFYAQETLPHAPANKRCSRLGSRQK